MRDHGPDEPTCDLDEVLALCPDADAIGKAHFCGVELRAMTPDQLIKVIWWVNRDPGFASDLVPA